MNLKIDQQGQLIGKAIDAFVKGLITVEDLKKLEKKLPDKKFGVKVENSGQKGIWFW